jgi:hypothetical protein
MPSATVLAAIEEEATIEPTPKMTGGVEVEPMAGERRYQFFVVDPLSHRRFVPLLDNR